MRSHLPIARQAMGIDPGASTGIAWVAVPPGGRPLLVEAYEVHTATSGIAGWMRWSTRLRDALQRLAEEGAVGLPVRIEETPAVAAKGTRDRYALAHLHQRIGACRSTAHQLGYLDVECIEHRAWQSILGRNICRKKFQGGHHRVDEASRLIDGASVRLAEVGSVARRVDLAESMLIALAAALQLVPAHSSTLAAQPLPLSVGDPAG